MRSSRQQATGGRRRYARAAAVLLTTAALVAGGCAADPDPEVPTIGGRAEGGGDEVPDAASGADTADVATNGQTKMTDEQHVDDVSPADDDSSGDASSALPDPGMPTDAPDALLLHEPRVHNQPDIEVALEEVQAFGVDADRTVLVLHLGVGNPGLDVLRWAPGAAGSVVEVAGTVGDVVAVEDLESVDGPARTIGDGLQELTALPGQQLALEPGGYAATAALYLVDVSVGQVRDAGELTWTPAPPLTGRSPDPAVPPLTAMFDASGAW